jgi:hypothetical protein
METRDPAKPPRLPARLCGLIFLMSIGLSSPAASSSVTIGSPIGSSNAEPFGSANDNIGSLIEPLTWQPRYQQVYAVDAGFPGGRTLFTGISFRVYGSCPSATPASGTFTFSLSSTTAPVALNAGTGLNVSNLSANLGSDNTVVYSGPLPAISGGMLTINFTTPFSFNLSTSN